MYEWLVSVVRVLWTGRRWADRPIIAASWAGGNRSNSGLSGSFTIFIKNFWFKSSWRACRDEIFAYAIVKWWGILTVTSKMIRTERLCTASSCSTCALFGPWCHTAEQYVLSTLYLSRWCVFASISVFVDSPVESLVQKSAVHPFVSLSVPPAYYYYYYYYKC